MVPIFLLNPLDDWDIRWSITMNKLKKKVFFTIFLILTISIGSFIVLFNVQKYKEMNNTILNHLDAMTRMSLKIEDKENDPPRKNISDPRENNLDENLKFMDSIVYTILLDEDNTIKEIINHSSKEVDHQEIAEVAQKILKQKNIESKHVGSFLLEDYAYSFLDGKVLILLDQRVMRSEFLSFFEISLFLYLFILGILFFVSRMITEWIIKPVKISFDKQKQFIADASHELKTPLSVIVASSEALEDNPEEKKWLKNIKNEAERMNLLITDLLELAESENQVQKNYEIGDLSKTVELSVLTFEGKIYEKKRKLIYQIEESIQMKMNENSIRQLVEILLDNAIKHAKEKGRIEVSLRQKGSEIILEVKNQGKEIPKEELEKIFERFYRVDKARNRSENRYGLGLAIAKNIVENHHGKISASSLDGVTTFKVVFKK